MGGEKIMKFVGAQRIKWWGFLIGWGRGKLRKITEWNPMGIKCKGHPKICGDV